jgi:hypothetical protein
VGEHRPEPDRLTTADPAARGERRPSDDRASADERARHEDWPSGEERDRLMAEERGRPEDRVGAVQVTEERAPEPPDAEPSPGSEPRAAQASDADREVVETGPEAADTQASAEATYPPGGTSIAPDTTAGPDADTALLSPSDTESFNRRWEQVQAGFLDAPRKAVQEADGLVTDVMQRLAEGFAQEREQLERHWSGGEEVSTEDLRVTLQRYRSFFRRLLST